jgi:midasin (ATPase involved in ribosome maturation)
MSETPQENTKGEDTQANKLYPESVNHEPAKTGDEGDNKSQEVPTGTDEQKKESEQGESKDAGKKEEAQEADSKKAPEKYELKLPEDSPLDPESIDKLKSIAKEHGMSNEEAQAFLENHSKAVQQDIMAKEARWRSEVETDKELGGDKFKESIAMAERAVKQFGSESLLKELDKSGLGSHPEVIRVFARIGRAMADDKLVMPGQQSGGAKSMEDIFYGKQT